MNAIDECRAQIQQLSQFRDHCQRSAHFDQDDVDVVQRAIDNAVSRLQQLRARDEQLHPLRRVMELRERDINDADERFGILNCDRQIRDHFVAKQCQMAKQVDDLQESMEQN